MGELCNGRTTTATVSPTSGRRAAPTCFRTMVRFRYESTVGGVALIGRKKHSSPASPANESTSCRCGCAWTEARVESGRARAKLLAAEDEIVYLDEAHLTVVEHPRIPRSSRRVHLQTQLRSGCRIGTSWRSKAQPCARPSGPVGWAARTSRRDLPPRRSGRSRRIGPGQLLRLGLRSRAARQHARLVIEGWRLAFARGGARHPAESAPMVKQRDGSW